MTKQKTIIILIVGLIAFSPTLLSAQYREEVGQFVRSAEANSILYRGKLAVVDARKIANDESTFFVYSKNYDRGDVVFHGKLYKDILLNLDGYNDELYVKRDLSSTVHTLSKEYVDSFSFGGHSFINYKQDKESILMSGYYEVLHSGKVLLYKKIRKKFFERVDGIMGRSVERGYTLSEGFFLWKEDCWFRVDSKRDLVKLFEDQKNMINSVSRTMKLDFRKNREHSIVEIVTFLD
jgi:hypothetical protein